MMLHLFLSCTMLYGVPIFFMHTLFFRGLSECAVIFAALF
jgi:hypothetical protein